jgi:phage gpG-like protein
MPAVVTFEWNPDPIVYANSIEHVRLALLDRSRPLVASSQAVQHDIRERFETETDPNGRQWQEWSMAYEPVAYAYPNEGILTQSGALKEAASSSEAVRISNNTVFYRTAMLPHYGLAHDQGLPGRKSPLPQREFLGMSDVARNVIMGSFVEWFDRSVDLFVTATGKIGRRHAITAKQPGVRGRQFVSRASVGKESLSKNLNP